MAENEITNMGGVAALFMACGTFVVGIFGKTGMDRQIKTVDTKIDDLKKTVVYLDTFAQYEKSQTIQHETITSTLAEIKATLKEQNTLLLDQLKSEKNTLHRDR